MRTNHNYFPNFSFFHLEFIQDDDRLREERKKAKKNKDKYVGMSNDTMGFRAGKI